MGQSAITHDCGLESPSSSDVFTMISAFGFSFARPSSLHGISTPTEHHGRNTETLDEPGTLGVT
jgi:hypothetical protein